MRLENCCVKEIRRGKSPKYAEISNVIVFAQKCNTKYNGIDISLAQYLDETTIKRYPTDEHMQDGDIVINSTGTGTLGRVGIYRNTDNTTGLLIVPDSHVTVIRSFSCISSYYLSCKDFGIYMISFQLIFPVVIFFADKKMYPLSE